MRNLDPAPISRRASVASVRSTVQAMAGGLVDLCFPPTCVLCQGNLDAAFADSPSLCDTCGRLLRATTAIRNCDRCGSVIPAVGPELCRDCQRREVDIERLIVLGMYRDCLREAVIAAKRSVYAPLALALGDLLGQRVRESLGGQPIGAVTFVPSHWSRRLRRGGWPTRLMACQVARQCDAPLVTLLRSLRPTEKQGTLSDSQRRTNVRGAFAAKKGYALAVTRVLVIDDVWTTGSTLREAASVIRGSYDAEVFAAVVARAIGTHHA